MIDPANTLYVVVQVSIAITGFAGIVTAVQVGLKPEVLMLRLFNLLSCSFAALFVSAFALVLLHANVDEHLTWQILSVLIVVVSAVGSVLSLYQVKQVRSSDPDFGDVTTAIIINGSLLLTLVLLIVNVVQWQTFWPVLIGIFWPFGLACYSFAKLQIDGLRAGRRPGT